MNIGYLICPNGLGHLRRSIQIVNQFSTNKNINLTLFAKPNQYSDALIKSLINKFHNITFENIEIPHPCYSNSDYNYLQLIRLFKNKLKNFDILISDNLIYPLVEVFDKRIIFISQFFWYDIYNKKNFDKKDKDLIDLEKEFLKNNNYKILGNGLFSMDEISLSDFYIPINNIKNPLFPDQIPHLKKEYLLITDGTTSAYLEHIKENLKR